MEIIEYSTHKEIVADEGMTLVRKSDGEAMGTRVALGKTAWKNGRRLEKPEWEQPWDYEEVPLAEEEGE